MRKPALWIVLALVVVGGGIYWWRRGGGEETASEVSTGSTARGSGGGSAAAVAKAMPVAAAPASIVVTVTDGKRPLADATVRIAPDDDDVIVLRTNADGVVRADKVSPGGCTISASAPDHVPAGIRERAIAAGKEAKIALVLPAGGRKLSGIVEDIKGGPVVGARIDAAALDGSIKPNAAVATTLTGADGKYAMTVAEGQLLVAARSLDYAPQSRHVDVGPSGAVANFALIPGGVVEGIVRDEKTKAPVPGALVTAHRDAASMMLAEHGGHHATANADGRFRLTGLRPGAYELEAEAELRRTKRPSLVGIGVAEQLGEVEIFIGTGPVVRGTVVDDKGAPVAGASIMSFDETGSGGSTDARSDDTGAFAVAGLLPGKHVLRAHHESYVPAPPGTSVELADKDVDGVVVRLQPGITIKGHVEPRQVAEVRFEADRMEMMNIMMLAAPTTTGPDGEFSIGPMMPARGNLEARAASGDQGTEAVDVKPAMADVVVKLAPGGSIAGRVLDGDGKPVPGVTVVANAMGGGGERTMIVNGRVTSGVQGLTNGAGAYELKGLAAGSYRMGALERGRPLRPRAKQPPVSLAAAEKKTGVDVAVDRPTGTISGVVADADGKPLADAWVSVHQDLFGMRGGPPPADDSPGESKRMIMVVASDESGGGLGGGEDFAPTLTDAQGRFTIGGLPHVRFEVIAEAQAGKLRGRANDVTPDANVTIQMAGVTSLSGTVRGPSGPPAAFTVELEGPTRAIRGFTDGAFSIGRVDPGKYVVRVTSRDGNGEATVVVEPNKAATVEVDLVANAAIVGTLVDPDGKPLAEAELALAEDNGDGRMRLSINGMPPRSGPDGRFRLEHKAGLVSLAVLRPDGPQFVKRGVKLEAGQTLDLGQVRVDVAPHAPPSPRSAPSSPTSALPSRLPGIAARE